MPEIANGIDRLALQLSRCLVVSLILLAAWPGVSTWRILVLGIAGMGLGAVLAYRAARRCWPAGRGLIFLLFASIQRPAWLTLGATVGLLAGFLIEWISGTSIGVYFGTICLALTASLALGLRTIQRVRQRALRLGLTLGLAAAVTSVVLLAIDRGWAGLDVNTWSLGITLFVASATVFVLTLLGSEPQTEADAAFVAVLLAAGLWLILPPTARIVAVVLPLLAYLFFELYLRRHLAAAKAVLQAIGFERAGEFAAALSAYRIALAEIPTYEAALTGRWQVHRRLNAQELIHDQKLLNLLDFDLCLQRVEALLTQQSAPAANLEEAIQLLDLIEEHHPKAKFQVGYWRALAESRSGNSAKAASLLENLLDDGLHPPDTMRDRLPALVPAWYLVLVEDARLRERFESTLQMGRRLDAIAAVEQTLEKDPGNAKAQALRPLLYDGLTLQEYEQEAGVDYARAALHFDHALCWELGKSLLGHPANWRRGIELCQISTRGKPEKAPTLLRYLVSKVEEKGDTPLAMALRLQIATIGDQFGYDRFTAEAKQDYFTTIRELAELALAAGRDAEALGLLQVYANSEQSGADTQRKIAELHERRGDVVAALIANERCLIYDPNLPLHLERRDKYYFSLSPNEVMAHWPPLQSAFNRAYCVSKARSLLDHPKAGAEQIDWALHLLELVQVSSKPDLTVNSLLARARLFRGERQLAKPLLELARTQGKEQPPSGTAEDDWLLSNRLLGDLLLEEGFPELALACFADYRRSPKSGAATILKMGRCYEDMGQWKQAVRCYENVAFYENALAEDARKGLERLRDRMEKT